jgi:hypothetical protein
MIASQADPLRVVILDASMALLEQPGKADAYRPSALLRCIEDYLKGSFLNLIPFNSAALQAMSRYLTWPS